ncbi:MAG TPA: methyltransferase domain-containing protein [Aggregatilineaceae bacterium]|nr:methyltransferase domain-containing protein [Aggregatilineaceae bacterium]
MYEHVSSLWWALVRFGFRLLYNELAYTYDTVSRIVSLGQWHDWQCAALKHLNAPPGAPILELAHGTGQFLIDLCAAGYPTYSIDVSRTMGQIARRKLIGWGYRPRLVRARAQALPFPAGRFAAVVSTFPTEFIVEPATLAEVQRVLRPGGRLVVVFNGLLTTSSAATAALEFAYRITSQRGPWAMDVEQRIAAAGFSAQVISEPLERSTVLLFVAEKVATRSEASVVGA